MEAPASYFSTPPSNTLKVRHMITDTSEDGHHGCYPTHTVQADRDGRAYERYINNIYATSNNIICTSHRTNFLWKTCWIKAGDRILLFMDANEHITKGLIHTKLTSKDVGLKEISHRHWGATPPHTHINGSIPIDGIFASAELEIMHCLHLSFHESVGDHRTMIVEISMRSILGQHQSSIVRPATR